MKRFPPRDSFQAGLILTMFFAVGSIARTAGAPVALKKVFKEHFPIGTAVNLLIR